MYPIPANATRIRYLESTGTQYIDTGYILNTASKIEVSGKWTYYATGINDAQQMGIIKGGDTGEYRTVFANQSAFVAIFSANASVSASNSGLPDVTYFVDFPNLVAKVNSSQASIPSSSLTGTFTRPFYLFARCESGTTPGLFCQFQLKSAKFWTNGVLAKDFVPVRVGQTGYLFDRVSGQLFGNAGTGDFVLGPDTFASGVVPTRMMAMGVRTESVAPGIYVEFDNVTSAYAGLTNYTDTLRFDLTPTVNAMNWSMWLRDGQTLPNNPSEFSGISICDPNTGGNLVMLWNGTDDFASIAGIDTSSPTVDHPYNVDSGTITITKVSA